MFQVREMIKSLRKFIERGRKGYCYEDLWQFDNWLSSLIATGLREFRADCHTYSNDCDDWEDWMAILDEMIECFEEQTRGIENISGDFMEFWKQRMDHKKERLHRGLALLERYYYDLWD